MWEPVTQLPSRHYKSGSFRQKYFLVALNGQLGLIDVWQERWFWRPGKVSQRRHGTEPTGAW